MDDNTSTTEAAAIDPRGFLEACGLYQPPEPGREVGEALRRCAARLREAAEALDEVAQALHRDRA